MGAFLRAWLVVSGGLVFVAWLCLRFLWVLWHKFPGDVALDLGLMVLFISVL